MTDRFDPRSPLPETSDAATEPATDPGCADDADGYDAPDLRREDPFAFENYLPGGSMHDPGSGGSAPTANHRDIVDRLLQDDALADAPAPSGIAQPDGVPPADASPPDAHDQPSPATDPLDPRAQSGHIDPYAPRVRLAQLPPLPTLGSHRPGRREWCPARRVAFLQMLSASRCVVAAARSVGMSRSGAYDLRGRMPESAFVRAWNMAFSHGYDALAHAALDRALNGVEVPHYYKGELVGTSRRYDERLTLGMLSMRAQIVHGGALGARPEDGTWELLLHAVVEEAEDEIAERAALESRAEESEADEA